MNDYKDKYGYRTHGEIEIPQKELTIRGYN